MNSGSDCGLGDGGGGHSGRRRGSDRGVGDGGGEGLAVVRQCHCS